MSDQVIGGLITASPVGAAVIVIVILFIRYLDQRDAKAEVREAQWREILVKLNERNTDDICTIAETMQDLVKAVNGLVSEWRVVMKEHDESVQEKISAATNVITQRIKKQQP